MKIRTKAMLVLFACCFAMACMTACSSDEHVIKSIIKKNKAAMEDVQSFRIEKNLELTSEKEYEESSDQDEIYEMGPSENITIENIKMDTNKIEGKGIWSILYGDKDSPSDQGTEMCEMYYDIEEDTMYAKMGDTDFWFKSEDSLHINNAIHIVNLLEGMDINSIEILKDQYDYVMNISIHQFEVIADEGPMINLGIESDVGDMGAVCTERIFNDGTVSLYFDKKDYLLKRIEINDIDATETWEDNMNYHSWTEEVTGKVIYEFTEYDKVNPVRCKIPDRVKIKSEQSYDEQSE